MTSSYCNTPTFNFRSTVGTLVRTFCKFYLINYRTSESILNSFESFSFSGTVFTPRPFTTRAQHYVRKLLTIIDGQFKSVRFATIRYFLRVISLSKSKTPLNSFRKIVIGLSNINPPRP